MIPPQRRKIKTKAKPKRLAIKKPRRIRAARPAFWAADKSLAQGEELRNYIQIQDKIVRGLRAFIDEMTVVFRFIESVSECHAMERILELLLDVMRELFKYEAAAIFLEERPDPKDFSGQTLKRSYSAELVEEFRQRLRVNETIYGWVFKQGHAIVMPVAYKPRASKTEERWSFMIMPLATSAERIGRLELVFNRPEGEFTQQTFSILDVLLKHAALNLVNERIYEKERKTVQTYMQLDALKRDIVNITTHEIKTPLTIINANAIMLRRNARIEREEMEKMLDSVARQAQRIDTILNQLVETAQLEDGRLVINPEPISLEEITKEIIHDAIYDPEKISFHLHFHEQGWPAYADRDSVYKVIRNLIENAIKYSPQGGRIVITGQNQEASVLWQIQDSGIGIPETEQEKIFEKFYRVGDSTTRQVRGMGFGLYLVKKSVELNGGSIHVKSRVGEGSLFTLVLPKATLGKKKIIETFPN
jgi:signal transduction histidine kinase